MLNTVRGFPAGFVRDLLRVTGCWPSEAATRSTIADVVYAMSGRPIGTTFLFPSSANPDPCADAGRILILSTINSVDAKARTGASYRMVVLHSQPFFSCLKESRRGKSDEYPYRFADFKDRAIEPPKKTRDVAPPYPESALKERGIVILDAVITSSGCVQAVQVLRSVDERLDMAALHAVLQWEYWPTLQNGRPVPIVMTVTVNFVLS